MATAASTLSAERKASRTRVLMRGTVFAPSGASTVWIRDISHDGALIATDGALPANCDVIFKRGAMFAAAKVAWAREGSAGLEFYRKLDDAALAAAQLPLPNRDD